MQKVWFSMRREKLFLFLCVFGFFFLANAVTNFQVKGLGQTVGLDLPSDIVDDCIHQDGHESQTNGNQDDRVLKTRLETPQQNNWGANRPNETFAKTFSLDQAVHFMDATSRNWQERRNCVTCHTNGLYMIGQAMLRRPSSDSESLREYAESYIGDFVTQDRKATGQFGSIEGLVTTAACLAISEQLTDKTLQPATKKGLDFVLAKQEPTGQWKNWLKCDWPPYEHDDHFGVSLMAIALAMADEEYRETPVVKLGMQRIESYLRKTPPVNAHQKGMLLWGAKYNNKLITEKQKKAWKDDLLALQRKDGGWSLLSLGDASWKRAGNGNPQDSNSDAYGTGFAIFVLRQAEVQASNPSLVRAIEWLKSNQRASGRWFVRSLKIRKRPSKHYISHAGTTFAIMALVECGHTVAEKLPKPRVNQ